MTASLWVVIPAAGHGARFGSTTPKQYQPLDGKTVLEKTIDCFARRQDVRGIVVAVAATDPWIEQLDLPGAVILVQGGSERVDSVAAAVQYLATIADPADLVAVHDAARPCVSQVLLDRLFAAAWQADSGVIPALPAADTVKQVSDGYIDGTLDRRHIWLAQTPQVFALGLLQRALDKARACRQPVTDDASAIELLGLRPHVIEGERCNIKITMADDLPLAAFFLAASNGKSI